MVIAYPDLDLNKSDSFGVNPLILWIRKSENRMFDFLVSKSANLDYRNIFDDRCTLLHYAIADGNLRICKEILEYCPDALNTVDGLGISPISCAV